MNNRTMLDKFRDVMFSDLDEMELSKDERAALKRYRAIFTLSLENPSIPDVELRDYLMSEHGIGMSQAYRDIENVRVLLGNVRNAGKEWVRYIVNETLKKAIEDAKKMGNKGIKLIIMASDKLGKYNKLDREDAEEFPWDEIIPQSIEPTSDPTVLGVKKLENRDAEIRRLLDKYREDIEIETVNFEPVSDDQ